MRQHSGSEVNATINDALFLLLLEDAWDDGLGCDAVAAVVHDDGAQRVQAGCVHSAVYAHALEVVTLWKTVKRLELIGEKDLDTKNA